MRLGVVPQPGQPVLRDITERVVVASKGRFDRARPVARRAAEGLPHRATVGSDDFMALTLDVWQIPPESARRVGHPAPFPVELPEKLIELYTYADDLVLDPFMGSGSALVAAARRGRRYVGYDLDPACVETARRRVDAAVADMAVTDMAGAAAPVGASPADGRSGQKVAEEVLADCGFTITGRDCRVPKTGVAVSFTATDADGGSWLFDLAGPLASHRGGLLRTETVWRALGRASALRGRAEAETPVVLLTSHLPRRPGEGDTALRAAGPQAFFDAVEILGDEGRERLRHYAKGGHAGSPLPGFWTEADLLRRT